MQKYSKKNNIDIFRAVESAISDKNYVFVKHAKQRLKDRNVMDIDVLDILENKEKCKTKRNKSKDIYNNDHHNWNYCIEGVNIDNEKIRIIISFNEDLLLIITVIRLSISNSE